MELPTAVPARVAMADDRDRPGPIRRPLSSRHWWLPIARADGCRSLADAYRQIAQHLNPVGWNITLTEWVTHGYNEDKPDPWPLLAGSSLGSTIAPRSARSPHREPSSGAGGVAAVQLGRAVRRGAVSDVITRCGRSAWLRPRSHGIRPALQK